MHKTELGIDFPQYNSLGLVSALREQGSAQAAVAEPASLVEETEEMEAPATGTDQLSGTSGLEAAIAADTDFTDLGGGLELGTGDELDLSGLGESSDETASIKLPQVEEEGLDLTDISDADTASTAAKEDDAILDLSAFDENPAPAAASAPTEEVSLNLDETEETIAPVEAVTNANNDEFSLDLGDLDISVEEPPAPAAPAAAPAAPASMDIPDLDLGDLDISIPEEPAAPAPAPAPKAPPAPAADVSLDGLDLDIDLGDLDLSGGDIPPAQPKKEEKKKGDFDIDIDLSDLKLE